MHTGELDRRVQLRHRTMSRDAESGQMVESWPTAYATVWAKRTDMRAREYLAAKQVNADVTTVFRLRYRADVLATDRIVCDGVTYSILPPTEIGRREWLDIMATATSP